MEYSATCGVYSRKTRFGRGRVGASYQISQDVGQIEERDGQARVTLEMQPDIASAVDLFVCKRASLSKVPIFGGAMVKHSWLSEAWVLP